MAQLLSKLLYGCIEVQFISSPNSVFYNSLSYSMVSYYDYPALPLFTMLFWQINNCICLCHPNKVYLRTYAVLKFQGYSWSDFQSPSGSDVDVAPNCPHALLPQLLHSHHITSNLRSGFTQQCFCNILTSLFTLSMNWCSNNGRSKTNSVLMLLESR